MRNPFLGALVLLVHPGFAVWGFAVGGVAAAPVQEAKEDTVVITNAALFTGSGPLLEGATLVLTGGKLSAILKAGDPVPNPAGGQGSGKPKTFDAAGRFVTPGLVDGNSLLGVSAANSNEQSDEITPQMRIMDSVDPKDPAFRRALRSGVTAAYVTPGNQNVIGGIGCVLKTSGRSVREMMVREDEGLRIALGTEASAGNRAIRGGAPDSIYYRRPTTRMGVVWEVRKAFYDAMKYRDDRTSLNAGANGGGMSQDAGMEVLVQALSQKLKVRMTARAEQDIRTALRLAEEFGLKIVIDDATEAYKVLDLIVAAGVPVVGAPPSLSSNRDGAEAHWNTLALLSSRGVPVALQTGTTPGSMPLVREAAFALRHGMEWEKAMAAVTSVAAQVLGVSDRLGSLEPGKDADFVVWTGDPLDFASRPAAVFIEGKDRIAETPRSN